MTTSSAPGSAQGKDGNPNLSEKTLALLEAAMEAGRSQLSVSFPWIFPAKSGTGRGSSGGYDLEDQGSL